MVPYVYYSTAYALYLAGKTVTAGQVAHRIFLATLLNQMYPISRMSVVKNGRGSLKVGVVAKTFHALRAQIILTTPPY